MLIKISSYCKQHIFQCITVIVSLVMAFGFHATHYSYHVDSLVDEYYSGTVLIAAGRFSAPLINYFTNWMQFAPFWNTILLGIILFFAGLIFALLFKTVSDNKISDRAVFAFWIVFSTFPIISYQLTFPILSVVLPYILIGFSMWIILPLIFEKKVKLSKIVVAVFLVAISIDMYESHASVFLTLYFSLMFIRYFYADKSNKLYFKQLIVISLKIVIILAFAIIVDIILSKAICYIFCGTFDFWYSGNSTIAWTEESISTVVKWLIRDLLARYLIAGVSNYSVFIYDVSIIVGSVIAFILSIKRKSVYYTLLYVAVVLSSMSLAIVIGYVPLYRMAQAIPLLVAFFVLFISNMLPKKKAIKNIAICILSILVLNQTLCINRYSVVNYERYQYETDILQNIAKDLQDYPIDKKEVLFFSNKEGYTLSFEYTPLSFGNPISEIYKETMYFLFDNIIPRTTYKRLNAKYGGNEDFNLLCAENIDKFFNEYYSIFSRKSFNTMASSSLYIPEIYRAFGKLGYNFIISEISNSEDEQVYHNLREEYKEMPAYPLEGYILEKDDMIIVKVYG